jgi:hypothetical protein
MILHISIVSDRFHTYLLVPLPKTAILIVNNDQRVVI